MSRGQDLGARALQSIAACSDLRGRASGRADPAGAVGRGASARAQVNGAKLTWVMMPRPKIHAELADTTLSRRRRSLATTNLDEQRARTKEPPMTKHPLTKSLWIGLFTLAACAGDSNEKIPVKAGGPAQNTVDQTTKRAKGTPVVSTSPEALLEPGAVKKVQAARSLTRASKSRSPASSTPQEDCVALVSAERRHRRDGHAGSTDAAKARLRSARDLAQEPARRAKERRPRERRE